MVYQGSPVNRAVSDDLFTLECTGTSAVTPFQSTHPRSHINPFHYQVTSISINGITGDRRLCPIC